MLPQHTYKYSSNPKCSIMVEHSQAQLVTLRTNTVPCSALPTAPLCTVVCFHGTMLTKFIVNSRFTSEYTICMSPQPPQIWFVSLKREFSQNKWTYASSPGVSHWWVAKAVQAGCHFAMAQESNLHGAVTCWSDFWRCSKGYKFAQSFGDAQDLKLYGTASCALALTYL